MPRVLHVIERLSRGGASRALLGVAAHTHAVEHRVLQLADTPAAAAHEELERADLVHVHFWNTPELYELLTGKLPPMRLLIWAHVGGDQAPHVLSEELVALSDVTVASTPYTPGLPVIPPAQGWTHLEGMEGRPHKGFNVGYVGTVDFAKMHPDYVRMSARVDAPDARFVVCGSGDGFATLAREAEELGVRDRFDLRGYVDDVGPVLAELDVFGYPLCPENYSATELVLQEAMYARVPPVVMAYGGAQRSVEHGRTGLVVHDEDEYVEAIERLHAHPEERRQLGDAAHEYAVRTWSPEVVSGLWGATYGELLARPKRTPVWRRDPVLEAAAGRAPGAARFVESLGDRGEHFRASLLSADRDRVAAAERAIATSSPVLRSADSGGVLHYRRHYPDDPYLRLWSGLVLGEQGRRALAAGEFAGAMKQGLERSAAYLAEIHG
jgi:hypothetical protein